MKLFFRRIHLYLAIIAGLVIMTSCLTGAILVFEDELQQAFKYKRYYVQPGAARVSIQQIVIKLKEQVPDAKIGNVKIYTDPTRSLELNYKLKSKSENKKSKNGPENNWKVFANPYTGEIIERYDVRKTFFFKVLGIHRRLLADEIGKLITGISTFIFLFIIVTGIVLWWPANRKILLSRLKLKTNAGWKRTNHDWHTVLGFYSSIILFVFAFTALAWSFKWFNNGIYYVTNSPLKNPEPPKSVALIDSAKKVGFDVVLSTVVNREKDVVFYNVNAPKTDDEVYNIGVLHTNAAHETAMDNYYVDAYSGKQIGQLLYKDKSSGAKIRSIFKPIHTGSIWGLSSKIIALIVVLIGTSLPITGYILWFNRTRKKSIKTFN